MEEGVPAGERLDPLGAALAAIVIGAATGGAIICTGLIAAHEMQRGPDTPFVTVLLVTAAGALAGAALVGWTISRVLAAWRRAVIAAIAASGTALVGVLTTAADMAAGRLGLAILGALCVGAILLARKVFFQADA